MENRNILIAGLGNIGKRYLEGLEKSKSKINFHLLEKNKKETSKLEKYLKRNTFKNNIFLYSKSELLPKNIYLSIIATTANSRVKVTKSILGKRKIKYWLFEKPLGQSLNDINYFKNFFFKKNSWVNLPRKSFRHYKIIKKLLKNQKIIKIETVGNNWGLCCNGIHFIHLFSWLLNSNVEKMDFSNLNEWKPSKKIFFWEADGKIVLKFSNNCIGILKASLKSTKKKSCKILITTSRKILHVDEINGKIYINGKLKFGVIKKPLLSETIGMTFNNISKRGKCELPFVKSIINYHYLFLKGLINSWSIFQKSEKKLVPIT